MLDKMSHIKISHFGIIIFKNQVCKSLKLVKYLSKQEKEKKNSTSWNLL
jgi:hypothetical protein